MPYFYIPTHRIRTESLSLLICFVIAVLLNVYAIVTYDASFTELWTSILYVLEATFVLYAVWIILRLLAYLFLCLIGRKPKSEHKLPFILHRHERGYRSHHHNRK